MKILFVCGNLCDGGAQRVISVVSSKLAEQGQQVYLLLYSRNEKEYPINPKVQILSLKQSYEEYQKLYTWQRIKQIRYYLNKVSPDIAVGFLEGGYGLFLSSVGMKFSKVASARIDPNIILQKKGIRAWIDKKWFKSADAVVVQTEQQRIHAKKAGWKRMIVIPNPISEESLVGENHNYIRECKRLIMVGRLAPQKNYGMAIDAMELLHSKYPKLTLDIYGKGEEEDKLKRIIKNKGLEQVICLHGWSQYITKELEEHDIYLLCSNFEGLPNSLMEAMAAGLPCISTNCKTGPADLISNKRSGFLVPVGDVKALVEKVEQLLVSSTKIRESIGQRAFYAMKDNYNETVITKKWMDLFTSLIKLK